ncbi:MAG TPA: hypothetical protein VGQ51_07590 [Puia sp.]|jgi:hypothetical protein|nr:hypothetical protein [Puia sp.]
MKTLFITLLSLGVAMGASAQRGGHVIAHGGGGFHHAPVYHHHYFYPRSYVGVGFGFGYPWGYGFYNPWGWGPMYGYGAYPPYYYGHGSTPPQLAGEIQGIKDDYGQQIKDVKHDKALTHKEKRAKIDQLKLDRDATVTKARHDYYFNSRRNYEKNDQAPQKNNNSSGDEPGYQDKGSGDTGQ